MHDGLSMTENRLRIVFMGTPDFAASALEALLRSGHDVVCVYSQPPRPKGRGQMVQKSPVHELADTHKIPVLTPKTLKNADAQAVFAAHDVDIAVVAAYGLILPQAVLNAPKYGCLNIHASLLPRWRGASPIQRAIWAGDASSGVTIMQMDEGLDTGDMIAKSDVSITPVMTSAALHDVLADQGAALIVQVLDGIAHHGKPQAQVQDEALVSYAHLLKKDDGRIDWTQNAAAIDRQVRALNPWPGVYTDGGGLRFKVIAAVCAAQDSGAAAGEVLDRFGHVACGGGSVLQILKIQPAGKQAMDFASAVNGGYVSVGDVFA
jgi:methionyl-tRNA formyltransferase